MCWMIQTFIFKTSVFSKTQHLKPDVFCAKTSSENQIEEMELKIKKVRDYYQKQIEELKGK